MIRTASGFIDIHAHFSPPTTPESRQTAWEAMQREQFLAPEPFEWRLDETLACRGAWLSDQLDDCCQADGTTSRIGYLPVPGATGGPARRCSMWRRWPPDTGI
jgi:hypothetical protein